MEHRLDAQPCRHATTATRLGEMDDMGEPITDDSFLILLNSYGENVTYTLPQSPQDRGWKLLMNTQDLENPFGERLMDGVLDVGGALGGRAAGTEA